MSRTLHPKTARQYELEDLMTRKGNYRVSRGLRKAMEAGRLDEHKAVSTYGENFIGLLAEKIQAWLDEHTHGRAGKSAVLRSKVLKMDADKAALITTHKVLASLLQGDLKGYVTLCYKIGSAIDDELFLDTFAKENPGAFKWVDSELKRRDIKNRSRRRGFHKRVAKHKHIAPKELSRKERISLGMILVDMLEQVTDLGEGKWFEVVRVITKTGDKVRERYELRCEPTFIDSLYYTALDFLTYPERLPMVIPPKSWEKTKGHGGYIGHSFSFIKSAAYFPQEIKKQRKEVLCKANLQKAWTAVDAVQSVPFRINKTVLKTVHNLSRKGAQFAFLDDFRMEAVMPNKTKEEWEGMSKDERRAFTIENREIQDRNHARKSKVLAYAKALKVANLVKDEEAIYFPHQLDFRGRMYPLPDALQPQAADEVRGLLEFAEGKPAGKNSKALMWLKIHGANLFGEDKCSYEDRVTWVDEHSQHILAIANDPEGERWWQDADKPVQFLAWCLDYARVSEGGLSHCRVAMDGTCNGLQHLSALLRDAEGGSHVNLIDSAIPGDIYAVVADEVTKKLKAGFEDPQENQWAKQFIAVGIDRKITKRPVMVMPYSGTQRSAVAYTRDELSLKLRDHNPFGEQFVWASEWLGRLIYNTTREVLVGGGHVMKWLQDVTSDRQDSDQPIHWETPLGFPVFQAYLDREDNGRVETHLSGTGRGRKVRLTELATKINKKKMRSGIVPNFVHSLDACHLMMTILKLKDKGVNSFMVIHDDYGTHAQDAELLYTTIREAFCELYRDHDPLAVFNAENFPKKGSWDPEEVLKSKYFFG